MNDRFKFRAWDKKHGIMVYREEEASREQIHEYETIYDWDEDYGCWEYKCLSGLDSLIKDDNFIVEQCTGLKDKNGKLIYENDLIKIDDDVAVIKWNDYYARFMLESSEDNFDFETTYVEECEIIGNIHENADLLENKE